MENLFKASVLAVFVSFCSMGALAEDSAPTVSDAHELIGDLMASQLVSGVHSGANKYLHTNYHGNGCTSSFDWGKNGNSTQINWSDITSVAKEETEEKNEKINVQLTGALLEINPDGTKGIWKFKSFYFLDESSRKRAEKAMTLLMNSCAKKSKLKFD